MNIPMKQRTLSVKQTYPQDSPSFWLLFGAGFVAFLTMALVGETLGLPWRSWLPGAEGVKSVTGGVKAAVYTFMSYL
jgi:light-harvesting complex 1 beta chain